MQQLFCCPHRKLVLINMEARRIILFVCLISIAVYKGHARKVSTVIANLPVGMEPGDSDSIKIVDGTEAIPHSYPYQVSLQFFHPKTKNWYHFCGGSILDKKTVITAAHCIEGFEKLQCRVDAGDHDLTKAEGTEQVFLYRPYEAFVYPLYDRSVIDYDYAIIKLKLPIEFNEYIQPIKLPEEDTMPSNDCWSTGWGNVRGDGKLSFPAILQQTPTPLADKQSCAANYSSIDFAITDRMVCAGGPNGAANETYHGICQGDSGGPLACKDEQDVRRLVGLSSFATSPCAGEFPAGYANVSRVLQWITTFLEDPPAAA